MESRFRTRMDRSLDEIAAEMHSAQADNPFSQVLYEERAYVGAEHTTQRSFNSRRYAPYPEPYSLALDREDSGRLFSRKASQVVTGSSEPTNRLFVGNLNFSTSWQTLKEHMRRAGTVRKCDIFTEANGKSKGMGLVQYESADSAERALVELQESILDGRKLFMRKHMDPAEREKAGYKSRHTVGVKPPPNPAATVFVHNLDYSVTWQKLKDVLKVAGKIVSVELAKDRDGKSKGHASVQFSEPAEAINAIALFHGQMLSDRPMKLKMDSSAPYQPDPIQLRLSGLAGISPGMQATPPPPPPSYTHQPSLGEAPPTSSLDVPFLTAVISSLTAEKLAAILIQNSTLGPSSIVGEPSTVPYQQLGAPPVPHVYPSYPPLTSLSGYEVSNKYGTETYSREYQARPAGGGPLDDFDDVNKRVASGEFFSTPSPPSCKVFVTNLNFNTTWHYIKNLFKGAGPVRHVEIFKDSAGKSKGCGIVIFFDSQSALRAIRMFNNMHVDGRRISVDHDRSLPSSSVDTR